MSAQPTQMMPLAQPVMFPAALPAGLPTVVSVSGPTYVGPNSMNLLFPFTVNNSTLELNAINNFNVTGGVLPARMGATVRLSSSNKNVSRIGPNFINYIKNCTWAGNTITDASSIRVTIPATVTQVQQLDGTFVGHNNSAAYSVTSGAPPNNYALQFSGFGITHVFLTPLTVSARNSSGQTFYITFVSGL